jgi:putative acetyltransferase
MENRSHQTILVRAERPEDYSAIEALNRAAFEGDSEARLVARLRQTEGFVSDLSLVAVQYERIVGHILFSPISIEAESSVVPALALAPMAVLPRFQNKGIGSALVREGLEACRRLRHKIVVVVGHARYYPRFGFVPARPLGIEAPFPVPDEAFMLLALTPGALEGVSGVIRYPPPFEDV